MNKDPRYFVLYGIFVWNVGMLIYNVVNPIPFLLLGIMMIFPTILMGGIFIQLDSQITDKESQTFSSASGKQ